MFASIVKLVTSALQQTAFETKTKLNNFLSVTVFEK